MKLEKYQIGRCYKDYRDGDVMRRGVKSFRLMSHYQNLLHIFTILVKYTTVFYLKIWYDANRRKYEFEKI